MRKSSFIGRMIGEDGSAFANQTEQQIFIDMESNVRGFQMITLRSFVA